MTSVTVNSEKISDVQKGQMVLKKRREKKALGEIRAVKAA